MADPKKPEQPDNISKTNVGVKKTMTHGQGQDVPPEAQKVKEVLGVKIKQNLEHVHKVQVANKAQIGGKRNAETPAPSEPPAKKMKR